MDGKHTPGPWHIDPMRHRANGNICIMAEQCTVVAAVPEYLKANARLIAAAPELLEALRNLVALHDICGDAGTEAGDEWKCVDGSRELSAARAIIAKAEGRE